MMAIFGNIDVLAQQVNNEKFSKAFEYLQKVLENGSEEKSRLLSYELNVFEKIDLDEDNFALEQTYMSKERKDCFFESHKKYIDVQFILNGEEFIEVDNIDNLATDVEYDEDMDLIKYQKSQLPSTITLQKGDLAIFYPEDAHMPCVKIKDSCKVIKTVVKVAV